MNSNPCDSAPCNSQDSRFLNDTGSFPHAQNRFERILDGLAIKMDAAVLEVSFIHEYYARWFLAYEKDFFESEIKRRLHNSDIKIKYAAALSTASTSEIFTNEISKSPVNYDYFKTFFSCAKTALALSAARLAAGLEQPDQEQPPFYLNPVLAFCGPGGCGKSHLLNAICAAQIGLNICQTTAKHFCSNNSLFNEEEFWSTCDILVIDDLENIASNIKAQEKLAAFMDRGCAFYTAREDKNLLMFSLIFAFTGMRSELCAFGEKLKSRLDSGLIVEMEAPDIETRLKYIENTSRENGLGLPRSLILDIARYTCSFPQMLGILRNIKFLMEKKAVSASQLNLEGILKTNFDASASYTSILQLVSEKFGLNQDEILAPSRKPDRVLARQIAMYLCRRKLGLSYPDIGKLFGGKDHSTVMHAVKKVLAISEMDKDLHKLITEMEKQVH